MKKVKAEWVPCGLGDFRLDADGAAVALAHVRWELNASNHKVWRANGRNELHRSLAVAKRAAEDDARAWLTAALRALPKRKAGAR